jgi:hypothetical protein
MKLIKIKMEKFSKTTSSKITPATKKVLEIQVHLY